MRVILIMLFSVLFPAVSSADNFVSLFMEKCAEEDRPLNNVNIGKGMLDRLVNNTDDEELKSAFKELNSIRIISTDDVGDSKYYYKKANELIKESFGDYEEAVSMNEAGSKISVWTKTLGNEKNCIILISLDSDKLSIITFSGKIDFNSVSKLSGLIRNGQSIH